MVAFELGLAQSEAMRMGRDLDVMGGGMERVKERVVGGREVAPVHLAINGKAYQDGGIKRKRDEEDDSGQQAIESEQKALRLAPDAG